MPPLTCPSEEHIVQSVSRKKGRNVDKSQPWGFLSYPVCMGPAPSLHSTEMWVSGTGFGPQSNEQCQHSVPSLCAFSLVFIFFCPWRFPILVLSLAIHVS